MLEELGNYSLRSVEDALDVDVEDALPFCLGDFEGWLPSQLTLDRYHNNPRTNKKITKGDII